MPRHATSTTRSNISGASSMSASRTSRAAPRCARRTGGLSFPRRSSARGVCSGDAGPGEREDRMTRAPVAGERALLLRRRLHMGDGAGLAVWPVRASGCAAGAPRPAQHRVREGRRRRQASRTAATVLDLEREMPEPAGARACGAGRKPRRRSPPPPAATAAERAEADAFWDWAVLELLLQSGLRIEEAGELTTLDVLRRRHTDGRTYYLLHVKPSKFDRARVIPIGDGLGVVIAEIIRHVKRFYGTQRVPACDHWDSSEKRAAAARALPAAGRRHPSTIACRQIRSRLARLSRAGRTAARRRHPLRGAPARLPPCLRLRAPEQQHAGHT